MRSSWLRGKPSLLRDIHVVGLLSVHLLVRLLLNYERVLCDVLVLPAAIIGAVVDVLLMLVVIDDAAISPLVGHARPIIGQLLALLACVAILCFNHLLTVPSRLLSVQPQLNRLRQGVVLQSIRLQHELLGRVLLLGVVHRLLWLRYKSRFQAFLFYWYV